jgi:hypothetical protein
MSAYKLCDSVLARLMQIIQEAMLTGIDATDLMRAIELEEDNKRNGTLVLTDTYNELVTKEHNKLLEYAVEQQGVAKEG